jgi:hypothetical protein
MVSAALVFAFGAHFSLLTYDEHHNLRVLDELAAGEFGNFFHHGSPAFYVFWFLPRLLGASGKLLALTNGLLLTGALALLLKPYRREKWNHTATRVVLLLSALLTPLVFVHSRAFNIEAGGSFLMAAAMVLIQRRGLKSIALCFLICGAAICWNYKMVLPVSIMVVWQLVKPGTGKRWPVAGVLVVPVVMWSIGILLGLPWHRYPATLVSLVHHDAAVEGFEQPTRDYLFYLTYLTRYDNILLIVGSLIASVNLWRQVRYRRRYALQAAVVLSGFLVLTFLPKAPRALLPYMIMGVGLLQVYLNRRIAWRMLLIGVLGASISRLLFHVIPYPTGGHERMAAWVMRYKRGHKIVSPMNEALYGYLPASERKVYNPWLHCVLPDSIRKDGLIYQSGYAQMLGCPRLANTKTLYHTKELSLKMPLLLLEHTEYGHYEPDMDEEQQATGL